MNQDTLQELLKTSCEEFNRHQSNNIKTINTPQSIFDLFFKKCQDLSEIAVLGSNFCTFQDLKTACSTKSKGDIFELFCQRYLLMIKGYEQVWLLKELSDDLKKQLKLPMCSKDYGIDLICLKGNQYSAVQCKFKSPRAPIKVTNNRGEAKTIYPSVNWKELSTFNELCNASGPWNERITMTTAPSVRRMGGIKDPRDRSICLQSFKSLTPEQWNKLMNKQSAEQIYCLKSPSPQILPDSDQKIPIKLKEPPLSKEEIRLKRMEYFDNLGKK